MRRLFKARRLVHVSSTMTHVDAWILVALFGVAFVAAAVDAIAGGGGLVTLPALLLAGVDPLAALATNKLQSSGGSVSATIVFARRGLIQWRHGLCFAIGSGGAAICGAALAASVPKAALSAAVPVLLIAVALYFAVAHPPRPEDARARISPLAFAVVCATTIGLYDGVFGPGTGSFLMIGFVTLLGYGVARATAHTKLTNAASNVGALGFFAMSGKIVWPIGLAMLAGSILGDRVGSHLAIRHGARLIRPLLVVICCAMAIKLLADPGNPLRQALSRVGR